MIEALAALCGLIGAFLLATKGRWAAYGWLAFLGSNLAWIAFALRHQHLWLLLQTLGFTATTVLGIWTWIVRPRLQGTSRHPH